MRFSPTGQTARSAILCALAVSVAWFDLPVWATVLLVVAWVGLSAAMAQASRPPMVTLRMLGRKKGESVADVAKPKAGRRPRFKLEAMPVSHFVEHVRWSLDLAGVPYEEETNCGILNMLFGGFSVPRLFDKVTATVIGDSSAALEHVRAQVGKEYPALESLATRSAVVDEWDMKLSYYGHMVQRYCYALLLAPVDVDSRFCLVGWGGFDKECPLVQRMAVRALYPRIKSMMTQALRLKDKEAVDAAHRYLTDIFDQVDAAIAQHDCLAGDTNEPPKRYLLGGTSPSWVDIKFASLSGPLLTRTLFTGGGKAGDASVLYARGRFQSFKILRDLDFPKDTVDFEDSFAKRPCGQYAVRLYRTLRSAQL